jgi:hypothetical protein
MAEASIAIAPDSASEVKILCHNGDSLSVNGTEIGVLEETDKIGLGSLLEGKHGLALESNVLLELSSNFSDKPLERKLSDEKISLSYKEY